MAYTQICRALERHHFLMHTRTSHCLARTSRCTFSFECHLCHRHVCACVTLRAFLIVSLGLSLRPIISSRNGIVCGNRFGFQPVTRSKKAYLDELHRVDDGENVTPVNFTDEDQHHRSSKPLKSGIKDISFKQDQSRDTPTSPKFRGKQLGIATRQFGSRRELRYLGLLGNIGSTIASKRVCSYVHPKQHDPFPDSLKLLHQVT